MLDSITMESKLLLHNHYLPSPLFYPLSPIHNQRTWPPVFVRYVRRRKPCWSARKPVNKYAAIVSSMSSRPKSITLSSNLSSLAQVTELQSVHPEEKVRTKFFVEGCMDRLLRVQDRFHCVGLRYENAQRPLSVWVGSVSTINRWRYYWVPRRLFGGEDSSFRSLYFGNLIKRCRPWSEISNSTTCRWRSYPTTSYMDGQWTPLFPKSVGRIIAPSVGYFAGRLSTAEQRC